MKIIDAVGSLALIAMAGGLYFQPDNLMAQAQYPPAPEPPEIEWELILSVSLAGLGGFWGVWQLIDSRLDSLEKAILLEKVRTQELYTKDSSLESKVEKLIRDVERRTYRNATALIQISNVLYSKGLMQPRGSGDWPNEDSPPQPFIVPSPPPVEYEE